MTVRVDINKLSDEEKSVLLAKARGWTVHEAFGGQADIFAPPDQWVERGDLYNPLNMALAWDIHLWLIGFDDELITWEYIAWWNDETPWLKSDFQRLLLDKILTLAIEAGLAEVDDAETR